MALPHFDSDTFPFAVLFYNMFLFKQPNVSSGYMKKVKFVYLLAGSLPGMELSIIHYCLVILIALQQSLLLKSSLKQALHGTKTCKFLLMCKYHVILGNVSLFASVILHQNNLIWGEINLGPKSFTYQNLILRE